MYSFFLSAVFWWMAWPVRILRTFPHSYSMNCQPLILTLPPLHSFLTSTSLPLSQSCYIAQATLELMILQPQLPKCSLHACSTLPNFYRSSSINPSQVHSSLCPLPRTVQPITPHLDHGIRLLTDPLSHPITFHHTTARMLFQEFKLAVSITS